MLAFKTRLALLLAVACLAGPIRAEYVVPDPAEGTRPAAVRIGERDLLVLADPLTGRSPAERAATATAVLAERIADARCGPETFRVEEGEAGPIIVLCGRTVLEIGEADAVREGLDRNALARQWIVLIRDEYTRAQAATLSRRLVEWFVLGILYPFVFLLALLLVRLASRRLLAALDGVATGRKIRLGPLVFTSSSAEVWLLRGAVSIAKWFGYLLLSYLFLIALFRRFPQTVGWARRMLEPLVSSGAALGSGLLGFIPRALVLLLLFALTRAALRAVGVLFREIRRGQVRMAGVLTAETAGSAELIARLLVLGLAAFLAILVVPGEAGTALLGIYVLVALALTLGARPLVENLLGGLFVLYGRPFPTGTRVRIGARDGIVERKGFFHVLLRQRDGRRVLVPNRDTLTRGAQLLGEAVVLELDVVLVPLRADASAAGLFRHAAAAAGLRREDGGCELVEIREDARGYRVRWCLPPEVLHDPARDAFLAALAEHSAGMGFRLMAAREAGAPAP